MVDIGFFFCHNLIGRAWLEEFAAEADAADSSDTDDEDDWHFLMGKRKKHDCTFRMSTT